MIAVKKRHRDLPTCTVICHPGADMAVRARNNGSSWLHARAPLCSDRVSARLGPKGKIAAHSADLVFLSAAGKSDGKCRWSIVTQR
jgi:hypothetical protein